MTKQKTKEFNFKLTKEMEDKISEGVVNALKDNYYGNIASAINDKVVAKLTADKTMDRIVNAVVKKIEISEDEYVEKVAEQMKKALFEVTSRLSEEVLKKVSETVKGYGFIKIADKW